jgi:hypothetical protein
MPQDVCTSKSKAKVVLNGWKAKHVDVDANALDPILARLAGDRGLPNSFEEYKKLSARTGAVCWDDNKKCEQDGITCTAAAK